ncbi:MAG: hypothetical protein EP309_09765 [Gammaproteobacteria bacterium]|nr:hypothetical protein [Candidatus Thioaporhodococcus sediminis]TNF52103.1 MAG: hypothetical protein EP309_09765 [Gammaproteobacteria bacterium]
MFPARSNPPLVWPKADLSSCMTALALSAFLLLVGGCASSPNDPSGSISITVKPGDTGTCATSPCQVSLQMPPGSGSYEVTGNQVKIGTYPAGQTVNLGSYWNTQRFDIVGANVPATYVYIPRQR